MWDMLWLFVNLNSVLYQIYHFQRPQNIIIPSFAIFPSLSIQIFLFLYSVLHKRIHRRYTIHPYSIQTSAANHKKKQKVRGVEPLAPGWVHGDVMCNVALFLAAVVQLSLNKMFAERGSSFAQRSAIFVLWVCDLRPCRFCSNKWRLLQQIGCYP